MINHCQIWRVIETELGKFSWKEYLYRELQSLSKLSIRTGRKEGGSKGSTKETRSCHLVPDEQPVTVDQIPS